MIRVSVGKTEVRGLDIDASRQTLVRGEIKLLRVGTIGSLREAGNQGRTTARSVRDRIVVRKGLAQCLKTTSGS